MRPTRGIPAAAAIVLIAVAAAGCGVGPGETSEGTATLRVTTGHGAELVTEGSSEDPSESETVVRFLDREAEIKTSYGGNFITAIEGIEGTVSGGRSLDWYYYVNGYWSPVGAGEATVHAGDRIWWDYRDWTGSYRVPAVVGSFPEPFLSGFNGEKFPTELICFEPGGPGAEACDEVETALEEAGAELTVSGPEAVATVDADETLRVLVGEWDEVRADRTAQMLEGGPGESGVFAKPVRCADGEWALQSFSDEGVAQGGAGAAGWVATVQRDSEQPTWVIAATSAEQLPGAAGLLEEETLRDHYAIASFGGGEPTRLPASAPPEGLEQERSC